MKVALLGLGKYVEEITEIVSQFAEVLLVEKETEKLKEFLDKERDLSNLSVLPGNATDMEFWREKLPPKELDAVISFLDEETSLLVFKSLRRVFNYRGTLIQVGSGQSIPGEFGDLSVKVISIPDILGAVIRNMVKGKGVVNYPVGIGLKKGEIVEVEIEESSPAAHMKISDLIRRKTRIPIIYRGGEIIVPHTDMKVLPGDRLLLVGEPSRVEAIVGMITGGMPNFPARWGNTGFVCAEETNQEIDWLKERLKITKWEESCSDPWTTEECGIFLFSDRALIKRIFLRCPVPSVLTRGTFPYRKVLVSANTDSVGFLLSNSLDLVRTLSAEMFIIYAYPPRKMQSKEEKDRINFLKEFSERTGAKLILREGNPVRETLSTLQGDFQALVIGYRKGKKGSCLNPYAPFLIAKSSPITTFLIPEGDFER